VQSKVSLIVPVYNEAGAIEPFVSAVEAVATTLDAVLDIIFVDDGSRDTTCDEIVATAKSHSIPIQLLALSRNFGKEAALTAGMDAAASDAVIPMDVDLQHPPEIIPLFIEEWRRGSKVVYGRRIERGGESWLRRTMSHLFYRVFNALAQSDIPPDAGDFRLMDRSVVAAMSNYRERTRFMKGLFSAVGFKTAHVAYETPARRVGTTKWNYWRLWNFALDGIFSFSTVPIRIWTYVGALIASVSLLYALWIVATTLILGLDVPGYASLITAILFMGGVQLISLGIIGEYIARIFLETKERPIYIVDHSRSAMERRPPSTRQSPAARAGGDEA
jgi:glycosyltransferase involved in cell wall biosynthesis